MAIRAIIEGGRDISPTRVKELAKGELDELGKPFELIYLMAIGQEGKGVGARFHTCGYQDTFITIPEGGAALKIQYGAPGQGTIQFEKNDLGRLIGEVSRTPWNMETLAAEYGDKHWKIMDADIEKEVRELSKKIRYTEETLKERELKNTKIQTVPTVDAEKELQRQIDLTKKNDKLEKIEDLAAQTDDVQESFPGKNKLLGDLAELGYGALKQRAVASGADKEIRERSELINHIVNYESKKAKGELTVE